MRSIKNIISKLLNVLRSLGILKNNTKGMTVSTLNIYGPYFTEEELGMDPAGKTHQAVREKMYQLVKFGLNPIRKKYGPTVITSGYRSQAYNDALALKGYKPAKNSQHVTGEACDIVCKNANMREVFEWLRGWWPGQLFYYEKRGHVHIALPRIDLQVKGRLYAIVLDK